MIRISLWSRLFGLEGRLSSGVMRRFQTFQFVYLKGDFHLITLRLQAREDHFMKASLLQSQFDGLEEPGDAIVVSINPSPFDIVETIRSSLDSHLNTPN
ncbi:MAG: hypothetical protein CM1200mP20_14950 [Pseudomonadota bacterium]|nr:MAG: hypothetical protein CM1200mP20_14950 [Pseudomonadota bacterium]